MIRVAEAEKEIRAEIRFKVDDKNTCTVYQNKTIQNKKKKAAVRNRKFK